VGELQVSLSGSVGWVERSLDIGTDDGDERIFPSVA